MVAGTEPSHLNIILVLRNIGGSFSMKRNDGVGRQLDNENMLSFLLAGVEGVQHPKDMNDLPVGGADKCAGYRCP
jgi:hypothetical protein